MIKIILENVYKLLWIFVPLTVAILLSYANLLPVFLSDIVIMVSALIIFILGIPLSVGVRLDHWSFSLGQSYSREIVLLIGLIVPFVNLNILMFLKKLIYNKKKDQNTNKEITKK
jgi:hypothetical protein